MLDDDIDFTGPASDEIKDITGETSNAGMHSHQMSVQSTANDLLA